MFLVGKQKNRHILGTQGWILRQVTTDPLHQELEPILRAIRAALNGPTILALFQVQ